MEVVQQGILCGCCVAAFFADVKFVAPFFVGILLRYTVDLFHVRLQGTALRKCLFAQIALVWPNACRWKNKRERTQDRSEITGPKTKPVTGKIRKQQISWCIPVWVRTCRLRSKVSLNPFPQKLHRCLLVSLWHFRCLFSMRWYWNVFWHTWHTKLDGADVPVAPEFVVVARGGTKGITGSVLSWPWKSPGSSPVVTCGWVQTVSPSLIV